MKKTDAFISFSFEDQDIVENVVNELENKYGLSCWTCIKYVKSGQSYKELIPVAIKKSCVTVVFISKDSVVSTQVPKEVGIALKREKTVIPFLLDNSEYQGRLEYDLEGVNYIDATKDPFDERVKDLAKAICFAANKPFDFEDASDVTQKEADNPQIKDEDMLGGIDNNICMRSGIACASIISTCLYSHNLLIIAPVAFRTLPSVCTLAQEIYVILTLPSCV